MAGMCSEIAENLFHNIMFYLKKKKKLIKCTEDGKTQMLIQKKLSNEKLFIMNYFIIYPSIDQ